jgi:glycosyltransferase involved in cell wall biosynthesis
LPGYFASAQAYAMPSTGEGFGIVFLEAAASGLPVIGGNRDGSVDALADGRIGRLVDPDSQDQIVATVVEALEGRAGGDPAEVSRFRFENFSRHVDELVRSLAH